MTVGFLTNTDIIGLVAESGSRALRLQIGDAVLDFDDPDNNGFVVTSLDLGYPAVREAVTTLPGQDGVFDETAYFGQRVVTLQGNVAAAAMGSKSKALALLAPFLRPAVRPLLVVSTDDDTVERYFVLRPSDFSAPFSNPNSASFTVSWKCPDPIAYSLATLEVDILPSAALAGRTYSRTYSRTYPPGYGGVGTGFVHVAGNHGTWPVLRIFGPVTAPMATWLDPTTLDELGPKVAFAAGFTIADGDYVEVDTRARTARMNGDPGANRYSDLAWPDTVWGPLQPGDNLLRFGASSAATAALLEVLWQDAYLL